MCHKIMYVPIYNNKNNINIMIELHRRHIERFYISLNVVEVEMVITNKW